MITLMLEETDAVAVGSSALQGGSAVLAQHEDQQIPCEEGQQRLWRGEPGEDNHAPHSFAPESGLAGMTAVHRPRFARQCRGNLCDEGKGDRECPPTPSNSGRLAPPLR